MKTIGRTNNNIGRTATYPRVQQFIRDDNFQPFNLMIIDPFTMDILVNFTQDTQPSTQNARDALLEQIMQLIKTQIPKIAKKFKVYYQTLDELAHPEDYD